MDHWNLGADDCEMRRSDDFESYAEREKSTDASDILHRGLLEIAGLLEIDQSDGIVELFEDLCPCKKRHTVGAVSKPRKRIQAQRGEFKVFGSQPRIPRKR